MYSRGSGFASLYELGYPFSQGITYTLQKRREADCDLATWKLIDQKLLTNIFIPQSPVTPRKTPIKEEQASGKNAKSKENILVGLSVFSSHLAHVDFYCNDTGNQSFDLQTYRPSPIGN